MRPDQRTISSFFATALLLLIASPALLAQEPTTANDAQQIDQPYLALLETLIDHVGEGRIDDAIGILQDETSKGVPDASRESLKRTLAAIYGGGGKYDGHEIIAVRPVSDRLHRVYAIGYHERQPLVYTFTMYRFDGQWKINHVHWDDNIDKLADALTAMRR